MSWVDNPWNGKFLASMILYRASFPLQVYRMAYLSIMYDTAP